MTLGRCLKIAFFAAVVLVAETALFHALLYVRDFYAATAVIGHAVIGVALGALVASRVRCRESILFWACALGTGLGVWAAGAVVAQYPSLPLVAAATAACVAFPMAYVAAMFREHPGPGVYLSDMLGAAAGVGATAALYAAFGTESIALALAAAAPLAGAASLLAARDVGWRLKAGGALLALLLAGTGGAALGWHLRTDALNLFRIFDREAPFARDKMFRKLAPDKLIRSYDSLAGRIDVSKVPPPRYNDVSYNGYSADHFKREKAIEPGELGKSRWGVTDQRVYYGHAERPSFFIVGSAARGILPTVKRLTTADRIVPVEIDPSIVRMMTVDFFEESGQAYGGLSPIVGNALPLLKRLGRDFDTITLMNTHASRTIGYRAGPDTLHTLESYRAYFDHLTPRGVLNVEERPFSRGGTLAMYRELHTLWHALAERGSADPSRHFFVWEWDAAAFPKVDLGYGAEPGVYKHGEVYFVGMIASRRPLTGATLERALAWYQRGVGVCRPSYLKGIFESGEIARVFRMIEAEDFAPLAAEGFDPRIATDDSPFVSLATRAVPEVDRILRFGAAVFAALTLLIAVVLWRRAGGRRAAGLVAYNALTGFGYFFVEVLLIQVYQPVYVSPSWSFVLVLGALLVGSGFGGRFCDLLGPIRAAAALAIVALAAINAPALALSVGLVHAVTQIAGVVLVAATGFALGGYFPRGLAIADAWGLAASKPLCFGLNAVAGSFAVGIALWAGVHWGYSAVLAAALLCYGAAGILLTAWRGR